MPALEWIKLTCDLPDKWQTRCLARTLKVKVDEAVGKLFRFWVYAENQSVAGFLPRLTAADVDDIAGKKGFALALAAVGWLVVEDAGLRVPHFDEYMGAASREREAAAERMRRLRERDKSATPEEPARHTARTPDEQPPNSGVTPAEQPPNSGVTEPSPKKEKEKEKEKEEIHRPPTPPPAGHRHRPKRPARAEAGAEADPRFQQFWDAYPHKIRRPDAAAAFAELDPSPDLFAAILAAVEAQKAGPLWQRNQGQYIPFPHNWLLERRWEDRPPEVLATGPPDGAVPAAADPLAGLRRIAAEMGLAVDDSPPGGAP